MRRPRPHSFRWSAQGMGRGKLNADLPQRFSGKTKRSEHLMGIDLQCQSPAVWKNLAGQQALNS